MPYVYSTLTNNQLYTSYKPAIADGAPSIVDRQVFINGGANLADKVLQTPRGAVTHVSDEDVAFLRKNPDFQLHEKNGFVTIEAKKLDSIEAVAADMTARDESAPMTMQDVELDGKKAKAGKVK